MGVMHDNQSGEVLRALLNTTDDMICVVDAESFTLLAFNSAIARHFAAKFGKDLRIGLGLGDVFDAESALRWRTFLRRAVEEGPFSIEDRGLIEGQTLWLSFNRLLKDGHCFGISAFARDLTQFERAIRAAQSADERFAKVFRHSPFPLGVTTARELKIIDINNALVRLLGYERSQMVGRNSEQIGLWTDLSERRRFFARVRETGRLVDFAAKLRRCDGRSLHVLLACEAISLDDVECFLISFADITPLHDAEQALRQTELRYRAMIETAPEAIVLIDAETGLHTDANDNACRLAGCDRATLVGTPIPRDGSSFLHRAARGESVTFEISHRRTDGTEVPCEVRLTPFPDPKRQLVRGSIIDISERKRLERQASELRTQLEQAQRLESLGTLAGGVAHDFNNILSAVLGYTELALMREQDAEVRSFIEDIERGVERAKDLVRQILSFSRRAHHEKRPIQAANIVREAVKLLRAALPATIAVNQRYDSTGWIVADPTQLHQVVMNLATNASLAMRDKGGSLDVTVTERDVDAHLASQHPGLRPGRHLLLKVSDTGCGIAPEHLERIFEPFFTTRPRGEGTGLGLSVVYGIVKDAGGVIAVTTKLTVGTTFEVLLPLCAPVGSKDELVDRRTPGGGQHVLFVDDDPALADLLKIALTSLGYTVTSLTNPTEAIEAFGQSPNKFDVLVADATMPKITGNMLGAAIKKIRPDLPMILVSGAEERITPDETRKAGFAASLTKPYRPSELALTIQDVCAASLTTRGR
jgi:PAS domain S-box-containing protein